jgi:hypothetical protein
MLCRLGHLTPLRTAAAGAVGAGVLIAGGIAPAATGSLPGTAQGTASRMLERAGVSVPGATEDSAGHADQRGSSEHAGDPSAGPEDGEDAGKGAVVSEMATTTDSSGVDKGAGISGYASSGRSRAGASSAAEAPAHTAGGEPDGHASVAAASSGGADQSRAPVETPNSGGTGTADEASAEHGDGSSTSGTGTADSASDGHSSAGSQNRR